MFLYNTLTRKKEKFTSISKHKILFYHCGPTVYWIQHIGNMRGMVMGDLIRRSLQYLGYEVIQVINYTDVGQLTSDEDEGEDKMSKGAKREGKTPQEIANKYIKLFEKDTKALNILKPTYQPRATKYIKPMQTMIQSLIDQGYAYQTDLAVYYQVSKFPHYYDLSKQKPETQRTGAGKAKITDPQKKAPADFALWFFKKGLHKNALQTWDSPWGQGFPGWHLECSVFNKALLADTIDIHMGGIEHISVHHTNEIAQSEAANSQRLANYWLHNEHLLVDNQKMSKSTGNIYSLDEIIKKGYHPLDLRYFFLQAHYRSQQNFTWQALKAAKEARKRLLQEVFLLFKQIKITPDLEIQKKDIAKIWKQRFIKALEDDFGIPQALAITWQLLEAPEKAITKLNTILDFDSVLGLLLQKNQPKKDTKIQDYEKEITALRKANKFKEADVKKQELKRLGYIARDSRQGTVAVPQTILDYHSDE